MSKLVTAEIYKISLLAKSTDLARSMAGYLDEYDDCGNRIYNGYETSVETAQAWTKEIFSLVIKLLEKEKPS